MSSLIRFTPDLSDWIQHNLNQGATPAAVIDAMQQQQMALSVARSIVAAFVAARQAGQPVPVDAVTVDDGLPDYLYETPVLRPGTAIQTSDRLVRIAARAERPRLAVLNEVFDAGECQELIEMARPRLTPSTLVDPVTGRDVASGLRSSYGMFFRLGENALVSRLDRRAADVMNLPLENGEGWQVLHYPAGAQSTPHYDFLVPSNEANRQSLARSGQRVSTMVVYLNEVERGGETSFPYAGWSVSPQRGNAVYFEYCNSLGQVDHASLHAGAPIEQGEKWVATKWMRQRRFIAAGGQA